MLPSSEPADAFSIVPGFPDPLIFHGLAGGPRAAASVFGLDCRGQVGIQPNHRFRLEGGFAYLRFMARGDTDLTMVVRTPGGQLRCNDDSDGLNPVVEGTFEPGVYEIYVGTYGIGAASAYDLGVSTNVGLQPSSLGGATTITPNAGAVLRSGVLTISSASGGGVSAGQACTYSQVSVAAATGEPDSRWTITCGTTVIYGAGNGGYGRTTDASWPPGTVARDVETSSVDTDPAFEWTATSVTLRDDASGAVGAFDITFAQPGAS